MRVAILLLVASLASASSAWCQADRGKSDKTEGASNTAKSKEPVELPTCPVMNEPVNFRVSTMTNEGPVYFCCEMCIRKFKEKPEKYADAVKVQREVLAKRERVQVTCPLSGEPIDKEVFVGENEQRVYFCCKDCKDKYEKAPKKYAAKLSECYTFQTRCPVMGGKINPTVFSDLPTGERVYFCCPGCDKKLLATPEKYAPKLEAQGTPIDVAKLKKALKEAKKP